MENMRGHQIILYSVSRNVQ